MRIEFDDEEYPELSRYLDNPKRRMKFLYFLEELFTENSFDPATDGFVLLEQAKAARQQQVVVQQPSQPDPTTTSYLEGFASALEALTKKLDGAAIGRFPVEHVVHEVPAKAKSEEDEIDYSSTEGIDFGPAIAMFED